MSPRRPIGTPEQLIRHIGHHNCVNEIQTTLLGMYKDVKTILDEHRIRFYVHFGTAIGTLRHDGFIPWDDDIDLFVWREDLDEVNRVLSAELDPCRYYYHEPSADDHPHVVFRSDDMEDALREQRAPFIDLFVIEPYPEGRMRRILADISIMGSSCSIWAIDRISNMRIHRMISWIPEAFSRIGHMVCEKNTSMTVIYCTGFRKLRFPAASYDGAYMHAFEDTEVPLPGGVDRMLRSVFGDYMTPPPEDQRTGASGFPCSILKDYLAEMHGHHRCVP